MDDKMENEKSISELDLSKSFEDNINIHGYAFQQSIAKKTRKLYSKLPWHVILMEFPVEVKGYGTRVDLILKRTASSFYIVAECKRANPAYSDWCFAKSSFIPPTQFALLPFVERIEKDRSGLIRSYIMAMHPPEDIYHVAIELKTNKKGDYFITCNNYTEIIETNIKLIELIKLTLGSKVLYELIKSHYGSKRSN